MRSLILAVLLVGCGGKVLEDSVLEGGAPESGAANGSAGGSSGASASSGAGAGASSGAGGGAGANPGAGAGASGLPGVSSGGTAGISMGSAGSAAGGNTIQCMSASACGKGEVCCATSIMATTCAPAPCTASTPLGPLQLCGSTSECQAGKTCGPLPALPNIPVKFCNAPTADAGTRPNQCGPANCLTGCCDASGTCRSNGGDTECGVMGQMCEDCTQIGTTCNGGRCGPASSPGCNPGACTNTCTGTAKQCCTAAGACGCMNAGSMTCR